VLENMRLPAFEFAQAVDKEIKALPREAYYLRTGRSKRLQEELYPLSRFALHLVYPGVSVEVEAFEDDGPCDGLICFGGSDRRELRIEVTYVHSYEAALRRELLWKTGSTPGAGPIHRDRTSNQIIARIALIPTAEEIGKLASDIITLHAKKCAKGYERGTILIIAFDDPTFFGRTLWRQLLTAIEKLGELSGGGFSEVHLFNCGSNELQTDA
jgi:hypothetical protein